MQSSLELGMFSFFSFSFPSLTSANFETQNLKIDLRHTKLNTALQVLGKNLVRQKSSLGTCIPFNMSF